MELSEKCEYLTPQVEVVLISAYEEILFGESNGVRIQQTGETDEVEW